jgi:putative membrane protein
MWGSMTGWGGPGGGWFGLTHLLWWALVVVAIVLLARRAVDRGRQPPPQPPVDRALEILRERYARGEIGKDEFEQRKRDLAG